MGAADGNGEIVVIIIALFIGGGGVIDAHDNGPCRWNHGCIYFLQPFGFEVDTLGSGKIEQVHAGEFAFAQHLAIVLDDVDRETFGPCEFAGGPRVGLRRWRRRG